MQKQQATNMGNSLTKQDKRIRILIGGLFTTGKTTILYKLKLNEVLDTTPTVGFNVEILTLDGLDLEIWDVGGGWKIKKIYKDYVIGSAGLIYVIDASDLENIKQVFQDLWQHHLVFLDVKVPILVFANKMDIVKEEISFKKLNQQLMESFPGRKFHIQSCSAYSGQGLQDGMHWMASQIKSKK